MDVEGMGGDGAVDEGNDEELDLRGDIEQAYKSLSDEPQEAEQAEEASAEEAKTEGRQRDKGGRFAPKAKDEASPLKDATKATLKQEGQNPAQKSGILSSQSQEAIKPPQSWKPLAREKWGALPPEVQQEVSRVDREIRQTMQESAESRRFHQQFQQTLSPYEAMLRSEGAEPLQAVDSLMRTAYALRTSPPATKAKILAHLVKSYDVPIDALDSELAGQPQQQGQQQYIDPNQLTQQVTQTVMQQLQAQRSQALAQRGAQDVSEFEQQAEFLDDVRHDVADLLDMAARRGQQLTLQQAYEKAVALHPELSGVLRQREEAKRAENARASTQRARIAATGARSEPSGLAHVKEPETLREYIEAAMRESAER